MPGSTSLTCLPCSELARLRAVLQVHSPERVAAGVGVSRYLLLSAAAGLPLRVPHLRQIRDGIARVLGSGAAPPASHCDARTY